MENYSNVTSTILETINKYSSWEEFAFCDLACGEGYYTNFIHYHNISLSILLLPKKSVWNNTVIPVIGNIVEALYTLPETNRESIYSPVEKLCTNGGNLFPSLLSLTALPNDKE